MTPAGTRLRKYYEPALATGPLNELLLQNPSYHDLKATPAVQRKEDERGRMHEVSVRMEA